MTVVPHLAFPLRFRVDRFVSVEQGSQRHLEDQADVLLRTRPGTLEAAPDLGLRNLVATLGAVSPEILAVVLRHVGAAFGAVEDESRLAQRVRSVAVAIVTDTEQEA